MYKLELGLPADIEHESARCFFDCKIRKCIVVIPLKEREVKVEEEPVQELQRAEEIVQEVKKEPEVSYIPMIEENDESDLLFDII